MKIKSSRIWYLVFSPLFTTKSQWPRRLFAEAPPRSQNPAKFSSHKFFEDGDINFLNCHDFLLVTWSKGLAALRVGASDGKSAPCLVWCPWVYCKWRYDIFSFSRDLTIPPYWGTTRIYWWEFLSVCHISLVTIGNVIMEIYVFNLSRDRMFKGLCKFMGGSSSR